MKSIRSKTRIRRKGVLAAVIATVSSTTRQSAESVGTSFKTIFARIEDLKLGKTTEDGVVLGNVSSDLKQMGIEY